MYLTVSGVNITPTVFPGTPICALRRRNPSTFKHSVFCEAHTNTDKNCDREISQPDVGADVHLATLEGGVHGQVNGVGGLPAVVLVDEHRVFCDVEACGIPVGTDAIGVRTIAFVFLNSLAQERFDLTE